MKTLLERHEAHGWMPFHVFEAVGESLGVAPWSVETRYRQHLVALERAATWRLGADETATLATSVDFVDGYTRLQAAGSVAAFALVDRALWADVSRAMVGLRVAERRRRQRLAEAAVCRPCAAVAAAAAA